MKSQLDNSILKGIILVCKDALKFYADTQNHSMGISCDCGSPVRFEDNDGDKARAALKHIEEFEKLK